MIETLKKERPQVYYSGPFRYFPDAQERLQEAIQACEEQGLELIYPTQADLGRGKGTPEEAAAMVEDNLRKLRACDIYIGDINPLRGQEPDASMAFECGYAWERGKEMFLFIEDMRWCVEKYTIPMHQDEKGTWRDDDELSVIASGWANLMLTSPSTTVEGGFADAAKRAKIEWLRKEGR